jgi:CubicO group peptidase (beta-lactamase class C family)
MTKSYRKITLSLLISMISIVVNAQSLEKEYDAIASEIFQPNQPGGVVLIAKNGNVTYKKAFGLANMELNVPMKTDMVFEIGSITKQFTAVAILQLMEQGKLQISDPITKYIPDYPTAGASITIHQLLTHTAGIPNYTNMEKWSTVWRQELAITETIALFKNQTLDFKPGENFSYSNSGYVLLGYIIEKASGMDYETYIEEKILKPCGMQCTQFGSRNKIIKKRVSGYQMSNMLVNAEYLSFSQPHAAGALMSTVDDFLLWNKALRTNMLLKPETLQLAETNYKTKTGKSMNYGYGWLINELYGSPTIEHGGGIFGFITYALYLPKEDIYIVVFTNCDNYNPEALAVKLAATTMNKKVVRSNDNKITTELANKYVGSYKFEDNMTRSILYENNKLYSQLAGGNKIALIPIAENEFAYEGIIDASLRFESKNDTITAYLRNRIQIKEGSKIATLDKIPTEITLSAEQLLDYVGDYTIAPNSTFTISSTKQQLFLQFPGQPKIEAFATSMNNFFTKIADVKFNFVREENQKVTGVTIMQNGQNIAAKKIK